LELKDAVDLHGCPCRGTPCCNKQTAPLPAGCNSHKDVSFNISFTTPLLLLLDLNKLFAGGAGLFLLTGEEIKFPRRFHRLSPLFYWRVKKKSGALIMTNIHWQDCVRVDHISVYSTFTRYKNNVLLGNQFISILLFFRICFKFLFLKKKYLKK